MFDTQTLHTIARVYTEYRRAAGAMIDKKLLRFNDIVTVGEYYAQCAVQPTIDIALEGVKEAVDACVVGDPQYIKSCSPLTMINQWMIAGIDYPLVGECQ